MSYHASIVRVVKIICLIGVFVAGYASFSYSSFRLGLHPSAWREEGAKHALDSAITQCYNGNDAERTKFMVCAQRRLLPSVERWGVRPLMNALEARQKAQMGVNNVTQCHDLSHAIGAAGVLGNSDLQTVLPACPNTCVYGCQHGAVSAWYAMGKDIVGKLPTLCVEGIDWSPSPQGQGGCFHELGHAVTSLAGNDIIKALHYCDQVAAIGRLDCGYGVFMELFEPATFAAAPQPLPANHPAWCEDLWAPYKEFCYHQAGVNTYGRSVSDEAAYRVCQMVPQEYRQGCFHNLGMNIFYVYQYKANQGQEVKAFCMRMGKEVFASCISGALLSSVMSQSDAVGGLSICSLLDTEAATCFGELGGLLTTRRTPQEKASICDQISSSGSKECHEKNIPTYQ